MTGPPAARPEENPGSSAAQRWLARLSLVLSLGAIAILVVFAELKSIAMLAVGLVAAV